MRQKTTQLRICILFKKFWIFQIVSLFQFQFNCNILKKCFWKMKVEIWYFFFKFCFSPCYNCFSNLKEITPKREIQTSFEKMGNPTILIKRSIKTKCLTAHRLSSKCWIFRTVFGCCALQMLVKIRFFNVFCAIKLQKGIKSFTFVAKFSKKLFSISVLVQTPKRRSKVF